MTELDVRPAPTLGKQSFLSPALAIFAAVLAAALRLHGGDVAASLYRVELFKLHGLTLWDSQWYGGHWTFDYSVIFPPAAALVGIPAIGVLSAAVAGFSFDRLVTDHFGHTVRAASVVFAVGTLAQVVIGQLPFLLGEALALTAFWAATRRRWTIAWALALFAPLASPLAGAFVMLAGVAWLLTSPSTDRIRIGAIVAASALPIAALTLLFPGQGSMPFPGRDFFVECSVMVIVALLVPKEHKTVRVALWLYVAAFVASFLLPTAMGGNVERLGEVLGAPIAICMLWPARRWVCAALVVPLAIFQWGPAFSALIGTNRSDPSTTKAYFEPAVDYMAAHDQPAGRVEIVPTKLHWEAAYAAPVLPLARGWERQLDTEDNPLFYTEGALTQSTYLSWLLDNGVRYVALPDTNLDYAAVAEGDLVRKGVPGLQMVWQNPHWKIYSVDGSAGLVSGPATVVDISGGHIELEVAAPGVVHVKERYDTRWSVLGGDGCVAKDGGGWLAVHAESAGPLTLNLSLLPSSGDPC